MMGMIIGFSSIAGMLFDFILCRILRDTGFRRAYLVMFIVCLFYPLILWQAQNIWLYLLAMAVWGLYYDLFNLGNFNFVATTTQKEEHASSFGVMRVFIGLGYLLAPFIAGLLIGEVIDFKPFLVAWIFLGVSILFFASVLMITRNKIIDNGKKHLVRLSSFFKEFSLWKKIGSFILPVLCLTLFLNIIDSFYWTIGPLLSEEMTRITGLKGFFMASYLLAPLLIGWFVGGVSSRFGKKKTAFISLLIGSAILSSFYLVQQPIAIIILSFFASFSIAFAWPSISGAYADYISETPTMEKEINTLQDLFTNLGFVIGPILAGLAGEHFGHLATFSGLGLAGMIMALILLKTTSREINIKV